MPMGGARNARHVIVVLLVAGAAAHRRHAATIGPTLHVDQMRVQVIALGGTIAGETILADFRGGDTGRSYRTN